MPSGNILRDTFLLRTKIQFENLKKKKNLLIIKHGALGDFILSFGPFKAIRNYHTNDHIVLLTTNAFKEFAEESNYFNEIIVDDRPPIWNIKKIFKK